MYVCDPLIWAPSMLELMVISSRLKQRPLGQKMPLDCNAVQIQAFCLQTRSVRCQHTPLKGRAHCKLPTVSGTSICRQLPGCLCRGTQVTKAAQVLACGGGGHGLSDAHE